MVNQRKDGLKLARGESGERQQVSPSVWQRIDVGG
jgi:hypothetical protein